MNAEMRLEEPNDAAEEEGREGDEEKDGQLDKEGVFLYVWLA